LWIRIAIIYEPGAAAKSKKVAGGKNGRGFEIYYLVGLLRFAVCGFIYWILGMGFMQNIGNVRL
jgi:hypothetical protein